MKHPDPVAVLEIGTSHTTLTLGEPLGGGRARVIAKASIPSVGVRKSRIVDMQQVTYAIEAAVKSVAQNYNWSVVSATLIVSGPHVQMRKVSCQTPIEGGSVKEETMRKLTDHAWESASERNDRTLLEVSVLDYVVDDLPGITNPLNMTGRLLTQHSLSIDASRDRVEDARNAAMGANVQLTDEPIFAGTAAAMGVLSEEDRSAGTLVIDLGGGCTSWTLYADGALAYTSVLGVGGDHVTSDIAHAFSLPQTTAEQIKMKASAVFSKERETCRIEIPATITGGGGGSVSARALDTVVNARMRELFSIIRDSLDKAGVLHRIRGGIVLTGGASQLDGAVKLAETIFGCHTRLGQPIPLIEGLEKEPFPPAMATVAGALAMLAASSGDAEPEGGVFSSLFGRFFN